ncbi:hypothetical protein BU600_10360 [Staphylococcus arlettae]|nr:hypothetical protein F9B39_02680 [Staphylococcus sp. CH99b_3]PNZ55347.1 hypothetical protein CD036_05890 [Staphylococcus arlettae]PTH22530.1 hypothetical protein BU602_08040 [Staphylococcus arlettae]PTH26389.1 hypothetical protein BU605_07180 [Staphylococcus arlettae]PTH31646.1 hypothetical protein BU592_11025 [Staphylococcus arlettae]
MSTTFIFSCFRCSSFWYCHDLSSLYSNTKSLMFRFNNLLYYRLLETAIALRHIIVVIFEALDRLA